jgi:hypothetical protein
MSVNPANQVTISFEDRERLQQAMQRAAMAPPDGSFPALKALLSNLDATPGVMLSHGDVSFELAPDVAESISKVLSLSHVSSLSPQELVDSVLVRAQIGARASLAKDGAATARAYQDQQLRARGLA